MRSIVNSGRQISRDRLKRLLHYDPETGVFTWTGNDTRSHRKSGNQAGCINGRGYRVIGVDGVLCTAHRLAFLYMRGEFPEGFVDHINRDKDDNRWANLRAATGTQNMGNTGVARSNTSGHRGVVWDRRAGKWRARIRINGRLINIGSFSDISEAADAYATEARKHFGEFSPI